MDNIVCNKCGKKIKVEKGIPCEDFIHVCKNWGYFSKKDGKAQKCVICEDCVEKMVEEFVIPSHLYDVTEFL